MALKPDLVLTLSDLQAWDDPLIAGIGWVSEVAEIAGGIDIFANRRSQGAAKDCIVTIEKVVEREPDVIIGSWCGKNSGPSAFQCGLASTAFRLCSIKTSEIKSSSILQPGPAALTDGLAELVKIVQRWATR